jgi:hypothetical protein
MHWTTSSVTSSSERVIAAVEPGIVEVCFVVACAELEAAARDGEALLLRVCLGLVQALGQFGLLRQCREFGALQVLPYVIEVAAGGSLRVHGEEVVAVVDRAGTLAGIGYGGEQEAFAHRRVFGIQPRPLLE